MKQNLITSELKQLLEQLLNKELYAQYAYRSMANAMQAIGYFGAQKFFLSEAENEGTHYQRLVDFLNDVGVNPNLAPVATPVTPETINKAFSLAFDMEYNLCKDYKSAAQYALSRDISVFTFLQEFVTEQRKSVGEYGDLLARLALCGTNEAALLEFDEHLNG